MARTILQPQLADLTTQVTYDAGVDAGVWLDSLPEDHADCLITSPPYWCQRTYGTSAAELGCEPRVEDYVARLVEVLDKARRVLKPSGWLHVNIGDTYANQPGGYRYAESSKVSRHNRSAAGSAPRRDLRDLPYKSLACVPDRVKIAMLDRGWVLRNVIVWSKGTNPLPSTATDRWWSGWEPILAFTPVSRGTWYDGERRDAKWGPHGRLDVWIATAARRRNIDHPAGMPAAVVERLIHQTCPLGGMVIDPFAGGATTLLAAQRLSRFAAGADLYTWQGLEAAGIYVREWRATNG